MKNISEFLLLPFVEIEIRLGTVGQTFDPNVDTKYFSKIKETLVNTEVPWKEICVTKTMEYISKNTKLIENCNKTSLMLKENVFTKTITLDNSPFDIRFSVNQEFSLKSHIQTFSKNDTCLRKKNRTSYISDNYRYDLTEVEETINNIKKKKNEIEIELFVNKETLTWSNDYINDFLECKIYDLVNIVEKIENKSKIELLG